MGQASCIAHGQAGWDREAVLHTGRLVGTGKLHGQAGWSKANEGWYKLSPARQRPRHYLVAGVVVQLGRGESDPPLSVRLLELDVGALLHIQSRVHRHCAYRGDGGGGRGREGGRGQAGGWHMMLGGGWVGRKGRGTPPIDTARPQGGGGGLNLLGGGWAGQGDGEWRVLARDSISRARSAKPSRVAWSCAAPPASVILCSVSRSGEGMEASSGRAASAWGGGLHRDRATSHMGEAH